MSDEEPATPNPIYAGQSTIDNIVPPALVAAPEVTDQRHEPLCVPGFFPLPLLLDQKANLPVLQKEPEALDTQYGQAGANSQIPFLPFLCHFVHSTTSGQLPPFCAPSLLHNPGSPRRGHLPISC